MASTLFVDESLSTFFNQAQDQSIRWIQIQIQDEHFVKISSSPPSLNAAEDFNDLQAVVKNNEASLFLYCEEVHVDAQRWYLVAFVPEGAPVRDKMLYASSRDSLKKDLGYNYFVGEYQATEPSDLQYTSFEASKRKVFVEKPLTESEILAKEELTMQRDANVKSTAMDVIPFTMMDEVKKGMDKFKKSEVHFVIMKLNAQDESVQLVSTSPVQDVASLQASIVQTEPTFMTYRSKSNQNVFIYACPEDAEIRLKMMYSTCKATVLHYMKSIQVLFSHTLEIREMNSFADTIQSLLCAKVESTEQSIAQPKFSKPRMPGGRGRRLHKK